MPCGPLAIVRPAVQAGPICRPGLASVHRAGLGIRQPLGSLHGPGPLVAPALAGLPLGPKPVGLYASDLARRQPPAPANNLGPRQRLQPWTSSGLAPRGQSYPGPRPLNLRLVGGRDSRFRSSLTEPVERQAPPARSLEKLE